MALKILSSKSFNNGHTCSTHFLLHINRKQKLLILSVSINGTLHSLTTLFFLLLMANLFTLTSPHFPSLSFSPNTLRFSQSPFLLRAQSRSQIHGEKRGVAVLWFKHDLRIDDHPALVAASDHRDLVPLYVFDHRILSRFSDEMLEMVLLALEDLRNSCEKQRLGTAENVNATHVYAEEEVEHDLRKLMTIAKETLQALPPPEESPKFVLWRTPFYDIESLMDLPASYGDFIKRKFPVSSPLPQPELSPTTWELDWGSLPTLNELMEFIDENSCKLRKSWTSIKDKSAESILMKESMNTGESNRISAQRFQQKRVVNSVFVTQGGSAVGGGTNTVILEGTARDDWQEVHERVRYTESREGASSLNSLDLPFPLVLYLEGECIMKLSSMRKNEMLDSFPPSDIQQSLLLQH
ncbi:hypothetical protein F8388_000353 [Cannabis sativa]|uniref:Photolyase/cryptochrome alpha/beta domain-containing protein n=1 Tax=Cannabis sativa TaxID=3483 RepID=A0A7J6FNE1_CANSA|nr:hypothetical protein F8388_000353 [Cannabis sativa]